MHVWLYHRYRSPANQLVLGEHGWVSHNDNGVWYEFDSTQSMFSQGNITEKIRMAKLHCEGEIVVDLFAGNRRHTERERGRVRGNKVEWNGREVGRLRCWVEVLWIYTCNWLLFVLNIGIGYFTLPILVHAKANHVYACEWNPAAVEGLKRGLERNGVSNRCTVLQGDNRKVIIHTVTISLSGLFLCHRLLLQV